MYIIGYLGPLAEKAELSALLSVSIVWRWLTISELAALGLLATLRPERDLASPSPCFSVASLRFK